MKKKIIALLGISAFLLLSGATLIKNKKEVSKPVSADGEWSETVTSVALGYTYARAVKANTSADYSVSENGKYRFGIRHGNLANGTVEKFDTVSVGSDNFTFKSSSDTVGLYAKVTHWQMLSGNSDSFMYFFTALENMSFTSVAVKYGGWPSNAYVRYYIQRSGTSTYTQLSSRQISSAAGSVNEDGLAATNVYAGDTIFYEFLATNAATATNQMRNIQGTFPTFTLGSPVGIKESMVLQTAVSESVANIIQGKGSFTDSASLFKVSLYHGYPNNPQYFTHYYGDGTYGSSDSVTTDMTEAKALARIWRWQMRCGTADDAIFMVTAKDNIQLSINWKNDSGITTWASHTSLRFYGVGNNGVHCFLESRQIINNNTGSLGEYDYTISLKSGDSLMVCYTSNTDANGVISYNPTISADTGLYNASSTIDYTAISDLTAYKATKKSNAAWHVSNSQLDQTTVLPEHFSYANKIYNDLCVDIDNATTTSQIDTLSSNYSTVIVAVKNAATFVKSYMHLRDYDPDGNNTEGDFSCLTYYPTAKTAFNSLTAKTREIFMNDEHFAEAKNRLLMWADANNETINSNNTIVAVSKFYLVKDAVADAMPYILVAVSLVTLSVLVCLKSRGKKHEK